MKPLCLVNNVMVNNVKIVRDCAVVKNTNHKNTYKKVIGLAMLLATLTACQSTPNLPTSATYQGGIKRNYDGSEVARVRTNLAAQYIRDRKLDSARQQLEQAFEANNRYAPAYDMMGVLLQSEGSSNNLAKADEYFRRAISLDANFVQARNNYGQYLAHMGRYGDAITQFEIAGATLGYDGRSLALENLGIVYLKINQKAKAKQAFMRAIDADLNSLTARVELVDLLLSENNTMLAKRIYDEMLSLAGSQELPARVLMQGIKLAVSQNNRTVQQKLAQQLLAMYPLSDEAKRLKAWLANPSRPLR